MLPQLPIEAPIQSSNSRSILSAFVIERGPAHILGPFMLHTETEARRRGVALEFCNAKELASANRANTANWRPLMPNCHPAYGVTTPENSINVIGRNAKGEVVAANSIVRYDWRATDYIEETESLRLLYADPTSMRQSGEKCVVTAAMAREITGIVAFSGAAWLRPDYRGLGLAQLMPRFIKACAAARWQLDWIFGMMAEDIYRRGHSKHFGFDREEWELKWFNSIWGGNYRLAVLWTNLEGLAADLSTVLAGQQAPAEIDSRVLSRNAQ